VPHDRSLRPVERRVLMLAESGIDDTEIARRFRHSPEWVARVRALAQHPRNGAHLRGDVLRPLERRVLRWRALGAGYGELSPRFHRSPKFLAQVESLACTSCAGAVSPWRWCPPSGRGN
jgi:hypothetical protein